MASEVGQRRGRWLKRSGDSEQNGVSSPRGKDKDGLGERRM